MLALVTPYMTADCAEVLQTQTWVCMGTLMVAQGVTVPFTSDLQNKLLTAMAARPYPVAAAACKLTASFFQEGSLVVADSAVARVALDGVLVAVDRIAESVNEQADSDDDEEMSKFSIAGGVVVMAVAAFEALGTIILSLGPTKTSPQVRSGANERTSERANE